MRLTVAVVLLVSLCASSCGGEDSQDLLPADDDFVMTLDNGDVLQVEGNRYKELTSADGELLRTGACRSLGVRGTVRFVQDFQAALKTGDSGRISEFMRFPLRLNRTDGSREDIDEATFATRYDTIFDEERMTELLNEDPLRVFCNEEGFMLSHGSVWGWQKITIINGVTG